MTDTRYKDDPEYRKKLGAAMRERYRNNPAYREHTKRMSRERYHNDAIYHQKTLERSRGGRAPGRKAAYLCPSCKSIMALTDDGLGAYCRNEWCIMGLAVISFPQLVTIISQGRD
jgi:hypothetical protein